jgi:hypothetical protein
MKCEQEVHVRQPSLLELNCIDQSNGTAENMLDLQVVKQFLYLALENSRNDVRPVLGLLTW